MSQPVRGDAEERSGLHTIGLSLGLVTAGFLVGIVATLVTGLLLGTVVDILEHPFLQILVSVLMLQGVGFGSVALGYLYYGDRGWDILEVRLPTRRDLRWVVGGLLAIFAALLAMNVVFLVLGIDGAEHVLVGLGAENPEILLLLIPLSIVLIGPAEELLFRGLIQHILVERFGRFSGIAAASGLFGVTHAISLVAADPVELVTTLGVYVSLSVVLGVLYEYGENLVIPALVHGLFNAVQFGLLYWVVTSDLEFLVLLGS